MKSFVAILAVLSCFAAPANAEWDITAAANSVKESADKATAKIEEAKAKQAAKEAEAKADAEAKKAEQQKAIDDARSSLNNLKNALSQ